MSKMIVAVFENEETAYEGVNTLRSLHREGSLSVYGAAVVAREDDGSVRIRDAGDQGPIGTAIGMLTGAVIGMFGGPTGLAVGTAAGGLIGAGVDIFNLGVGEDFVSEVSTKLEPGKVAIVAEVDETWVTPLDTRMAELGAEVIRRSRLDIEDEQFDRDIEAAKADYRAVKEELATTHADNKAAVQAKLDAANERLTAAVQKSEARHQQAMQDGQAKVDALVEQAKTANDERRAEIEARLAEIREDNAQRKQKLDAAWELTKEALAA
ncbi:MAG: DUF1269 domain-containing protein [Woeseiaceae bacterium]|nr:DUF1269 domain-containing protein [Woeseiaceae bacterium]